MRKFVIITGCLMLLVAGMVLATESTEISADAGLARRTPMSMRAAEVRLVLDTQRSTLAVLEEEYRSALDEATALEIQKRMEKLARNTELQILGIQADYLRATGRVKEAEAIEEAVKEMQAPPRKRIPVERSRPDADRVVR